MNRAQLIEKLMSEGFTEKTLVKFNDIQLEKFANKVLKEAQTVTTTKTVYNSKDPKDVATLNSILKDPKVDKTKIEVKEDEVIPLNESDVELSEKNVPRIPEFMSFDSIISAGEKEAPEKDAPGIDAPPKETPDVDRPERDPRRAPFRNPNEEPAVDPRPKAKTKKLNSMPMAAE